MMGKNEKSLRLESGIFVIQLETRRRDFQASSTREAK